MVAIGEGVFETLKVVESRPFAVTRHLDRMATSASRVGLPVPAPEEMRLALDEHLRDRRLALGRMRMDWVLTSDGADLSIASEPTVEPLPSVALTLDDWTIDQDGPLAGIKSTRYEGFAAAKVRAQAAGYDDALLSNAAGLVCEASTANLFYVVDGELRTPAPDTGCLPGIVRGLVIELVDVVEARDPMSVLRDASEVFVTSSLREVQPVSRIGERLYPEEGPVTTEVADAWSRLLAVTSDPPLAITGER